MNQEKYFKALTFLKTIILGPKLHSNWSLHNQLDVEIKQTYPYD